MGRQRAASQNNIGKKQDAWQRCLPNLPGQPNNSYGHRYKRRECDRSSGRFAPRRRLTYGNAEGNYEWSNRNHTDGVRCEPNPPTAKERLRYDEKPSKGSGKRRDTSPDDHCDEQTKHVTQP